MTNPQQWKRAYSITATAFPISNLWQNMAVRISYWSDATDSANGQKKNVFQIINKCL